ncbi:cyclic dehypoxanthinyl futalosine synthase [Leptospira interrogans]|uniref:Cyclic dehypoxanthine futalosine synthase n=1 Tax=Leptospira interrogans serovar Lora str. TE 1992 TaxID=1193028 RepID=M3CIS1_LEPIR|nr:cyclic dehypoxanthinyl futalosine synthase [Leptospira interrogans]EMF41314.1 menaquinone biosynthesis radical SAM enzyme, TIGR03699 family [Leptospira interrogans serovar Lora str. TE 1992]AKH76813.1 radical SAM protein [Leptospira interrogans serovar Bratislava]EMN08616.1 menaquinone biosynthesis protein, TIGR03699 family [Leptospira interrogans serovar Muenchen str. Brem 129]KLO75129.1 Cyclic dehypoxanthine futalosine synthase [Leptospira interrogans serovar Muenchen]KWV25189.1 hypotheti
MASIFSSQPTDRILEKALDGNRISPEEALALYREGDHLKIMATARSLREKILPHHYASYTMFRVVNYTNYCNVECSFCSFMDEIGNGKGYVLSVEEILEKMDYAVGEGADQMFLQGGVYPDLSFDYYLNVISAVKKKYPHMHIRAFSPVEIINLEKITGLPLKEVLQILKQTGLDSVPGAGAEILTDRMRNIISPKKATTEEWVRAMETCHEVGLPGSANIVFGSEETQEEVIEHLNVVRNLQDRTGGFLSFIPWTFQPQTKRFTVRAVPTQEYLKVLGICRIFLDNILHIETSVMVLGKGVGQLALTSGADDISSVVIEENVLRSYGLKTEKEAVKFLKEGGFTPKRRDLLYNYDRYENELIVDFV